MKIVSIVNRKGGVGKTTMSVHIAAGMAMAGYNVGLADMDSQGHVALTLGLEKEDGLYAALIDKKPVKEVMRLVDPANYAPTKEAARGNLRVVASAYRRHVSVGTFYW